MEIADARHEGILVLAIKGRLDANTSGVAQDKILAFIDQGETRIVADLSQLAYISSAGLRVFMMAAKRMKSGQGKIVLCSLNNSLKEIFQIAGFTHLLPIHETREDALQSLAAP